MLKINQLSGFGRGGVSSVSDIAFNTSELDQTSVAGAQTDFTVTFQAGMVVFLEAHGEPDAGTPLTPSSIVIDPAGVAAAATLQLGAARDEEQGGGDEVGVSIWMYDNTAGTFSGAKTVRITYSSAQNTCHLATVHLDNAAANANDVGSAESYTSSTLNVAVNVTPTLAVADVDIYLYVMLSQKDRDNSAADGTELYDSLSTHRFFAGWMTYADITGNSIDLVNSSNNAKAAVAIGIKSG